MYVVLLSLNDSVLLRSISIIHYLNFGVVISYPPDLRSHCRKPPLSAISDPEMLCKAYNLVLRFLLAEM